MKLFKILFTMFFLSAVNLHAAWNTFSPMNGNHIVNGRIDLRKSNTIKVRFSSYPRWIIGRDEGGLSVWYVLLDDSKGHRITVDRNCRVSVFKANFRVQSDTIIAFDTGSSKGMLFSREQYKNNFLTFPVRIEANNKVAVIDSSRVLGIRDENIVYKLKIDPLRDGRILQNNSGQLLVLTGNSSAYQHGILGDSIEAVGFAVINTENKPEVNHQFTLSGRSVFETLMPIWTDIDLDGKSEVILTKSDSRSGAQLQVYTEDGNLTAAGDPIGRGFRWMHHIAAAGFGPAGEIEIAAVRTPHIGGVLEFYQLKGSRLQVVHSRAGYSSHRIGSRNLESAAAGDFNDDGHVELLVPSQDFKRLDLIRRTPGGSKIDHSIFLNDQMSSNLAAYSSGGKIKLAFGTYNNELIIIQQ